MPLIFPEIERNGTEHIFIINVDMVVGGTLLVAQMVEALRYKPEGRGFDYRWCHWIFSFT
jgi:hypothetical protein